MDESLQVICLALLIQKLQKYPTIFFYFYTEIGMQTTEIHSPQLFLVIIVVQLFVEAALGFLLLI